MLVGLDTGFFFAVESEHAEAVEVWKNQEVVTSAIVLYELQKKLLQGDLRKWSTLLEDIAGSAAVFAVTLEIALRAGHIAHGTGMPGLDALILASLLDAGCEAVYTTDPHFKLYQKKGIRIHLLKLQD